MREEPVFVSVQDFAERVAGLSPRSVWELVRTGQVPSLKIGRRRLIKVQDGIAALERMAAQGNSADEESRIDSGAH